MPDGLAPQMAMSAADPSGGPVSDTVPESPVDDRTYNVLQALTSKLEAIEAYQVYQEDDDSGLFEELIEDERRQASRLLDELRGLLAR
jgi:DNA-binding MarR family transcriptional regulator